MGFKCVCHGFIHFCSSCLHLSPNLCQQFAYVRGASCCTEGMETLHCMSAHSAHLQTSWRYSNTSCLCILSVVAPQQLYLPRWCQGWDAAAVTAPQRAKSEASFHFPACESLFRLSRLSCLSVMKRKNLQYLCHTREDLENAVSWLALSRFSGHYSTLHKAG